jgi:hypothetical protein
VGKRKTCYDLSTEAISEGLGFREDLF